METTIDQNRMILMGTILGRNARLGRSKKWHYMLEISKQKTHPRRNNKYGLKKSYDQKEAVADYRISNRSNSTFELFLAAIFLLVLLWRGMILILIVIIQIHFVMKRTVV